MHFLLNTGHTTSFPFPLMHSVHHNLTLKHVLADAFPIYLIMLSSTCFTVKYIIDHGYLL